jgi:hypothetical protein
MHVDFLRSALGLPFPARPLKVPHQLLLLGVHRDDGVVGAVKLVDAGVDILKLRIAIEVLSAFPCFPIRL